MSDYPVINNQHTIIDNQTILTGNQQKIIDNQIIIDGKINEILKNQETIANNQTIIEGKINEILKNQNNLELMKDTILKIGGNQTTLNEKLDKILTLLENR